MARRSKRTRKNKRALNLTKKAAMTAGSLSAIALAPAAAHAAVVNVSGSPVSLSMSAAYPATVNWDVDGAGGTDFALWKAGPPGTDSIQLASQTIGGSSLNGRGLVGPTFYTDDVQALQQSFSVGPTLPNSYVWGNQGIPLRNAMSAGTFGGTIGGPSYFIGYDFDAHGFGIGNNFFGFRFLDAAGAMHYGWANINFDTTNGVVSITKWAYESTPDTAIHIPSTVIPLPGAHALGLLGLGAAGLMSWRQRRKEKATAEV